VAITLPDGKRTPGVIASVGKVASSGTSGTPTITVLVTLSRPAATKGWDDSSVNVTITISSVSNALVVPVDALLALASGGYAVEVVSSDGIHHLAAVSLGLFDDADGLVQVTRSGLTSGEPVVVPAL
jgi:hypothetical protein